MKRFAFVILIFLSVLSCTKDKAIMKLPEPPPPPPPPKVQFIFINKNGFRQDSVGNGIIDTVFTGVCIKLGHYKKKVNVTYLQSTCYGRNDIDAELKLKDSLLIYSDSISVGDKCGIEFELIWKRNVLPHAVRIYKYAMPSWPVGDTVKELKDMVIKFVWPTDTNSGKFIKTYQYP